MPSRTSASSAPSPAGTVAAPATRSTTTCLPTRCWTGARGTRPDRALAEEREAARRRHRRLAIIVGLAVVGLALMGLLTAFAFAKRSEAEKQAQRANEAQLAAEAARRTAEDAQEDAERSAKEATTQKKAAQKSARPAKSAEAAAQQGQLKQNNKPRSPTGSGSRRRNQRGRPTEARSDAERHATAEAAAKRDGRARKERGPSLEKRGDRRSAPSRGRRKNEERARAQAIAPRDQAPRQRRSSSRRSPSQQTIDPEQSLALALQAAGMHARRAGGGSARRASRCMRARRFCPGRRAGRTMCRRAPTARSCWSSPARAKRASTTSNRQARFDTAPHGSPLNAAVFSPDGASVVTAGRDGVARRWDAPSGSSSLGTRHGAAIRDVAFSPDGRLVRHRRRPGGTRLAAADGAPIAAAAAPAAVAGVSFNPAGTLLMTVAGDARLFQTSGWQRRRWCSTSPAQILDGELRARRAPRGRPAAATTSR